MPHSVVARSGSAASGETLVAHPAPLLLHASCVQLDGRGIVLLGASGAGKSDLALRLIDAGAILVADDQLLVEHGPAGPVGRSADALAGLLEVRGVGILRLPYCRISPLALAVELDGSRPVTRMPTPATYDLLGTQLRLLHLDPRSPSAVAKLRFAMIAELVD